MSNEPANLTVLSNGMAVVTRYAESAATTDIVIRVRAGSRDEVGSNLPRGTAHFYEHMVCTGSSVYPERARDLIETMRGFDKSPLVGHHFTPATQFCYTNYHASVPASETYPVLGVMCDMLSQPLFRLNDIEAQRRYISNERIQTQLSYQSDNVDKWSAPYIAYGQNPLLYPVIGDKQGIRDVNADHLRAFQAQHMTSNRTVVAVEGVVSHDAIVRAVERQLVLPSGLRPFSEAPLYTGGDARYWLPGDGGTHVVLAFKAPPEGDDSKSIAFKVASRLLMAERGQHSIPMALGSDNLGVYAHSTNRTQMLDTGLFTVTFNAMDVRPCLDAVQRIMYDMTDRIDPVALDQVRKQQESHIKIASDLFKHGVLNMSHDVALHGQLKPPDYYSRLRVQVSEREIKEAVREMLSHPPTFVAAGDLAPLPNPQEVRDLFMGDSRGAVRPQLSYATQSQFQSQYAAA